MKISTKGRYALRMMLDIAQHDTGEPVRIKDISVRQEISLKYLEQIVSILVKAGLLRSIRGPQGGYRLTRRPGAYVIGDILRLTEGSLSPSGGFDETADDGGQISEYVLQRLWRELDEAISSVVDKYTLEDLMNWSDEMVNNYVI